MPSGALSAALKAEATRLGFDACGVTLLPVELRADYYRRWLAEGRHAGMEWMTHSLGRRLNPEQLLPEVKSLISLGINSYQPQPAGRRFRVATYALGGDYHNFFQRRLKKLCSWLRTQGGHNLPYCDTGPVLEKPVAAAAGLGWQGKNTLLLNHEHGTWLLLGTIATTLEFAPDPIVKPRCGSCSRCLDICPTQAFPAPFQLDARRCLAYHSIESQDAIPVEFREAMGDRAYGCDDCLDVCPWNKWAKVTREHRFQARDLPDPAIMLDWTQEEFEAALVASPLKRLGLSRWRRNLCVVLGNVGTPADLPVLERHAQGLDPMVAEHAAWAVERITARTK